MGKLTANFQLFLDRADDIQVASGNLLAASRLATDEDAKAFVLSGYIKAARLSLKQAELDIGLRICRDGVQYCDKVEGDRIYRDPLLLLKHLFASLKFWDLGEEASAQREWRKLDRIIADNSILGIEEEKLLTQIGVLKTVDFALRRCGTALNFQEAIGICNAAVPPMEKTVWEAVGPVASPHEPKAIWGRGCLRLLYVLKEFAIALEGGTVDVAALKDFREALWRSGLRKRASFADSVLHNLKRLPALFKGSRPAHAIPPEEQRVWLANIPTSDMAFKAASEGKAYARMWVTGMPRKNWRTGKPIAEKEFYRIVARSEDFSLLLVDSGEASLDRGVGQIYLAGQLLKPRVIAPLQYRVLVRAIRSRSGHLGTMLDVVRECWEKTRQHATCQELVRAVKRIKEEEAGAKGDYYRLFRKRSAEIYAMNKVLRRSRLRIDCPEGVFSLHPIDDRPSRTCLLRIKPR